MSPADADDQAGAVQSLLAALPSTSRGAASLAFDGAERTGWSYLPGERAGVAMHALAREHQQQVLRLLATVLRPHAVAQVAAVMALEDVLDLAEGGSGRRHRGDYWFAAFGTPGDPSWGWRLEGHHVSVNLTVVDGRVRTVPLFVGANPAAVRHDGVAVLRPLGREEDLARDALAAMDDAARRQAVVDRRAPRDIRTGRAPVVESFDSHGVRAGELRGDAGSAVRRLAALHLDRLAPGHAAETIIGLDDGGWDELRFQWRGSTEPGEPHYYALAGAGLLVEYDNTQNDANHVHCVLRLPAQDFGADLLADHYARHH